MILKQAEGQLDLTKYFRSGFIVYDEKFTELNKLNIKSRINSDIVPSINALRVNRLKMSDLLSEKLSCYEMTLRIKKLFK